MVSTPHQQRNELQAYLLELSEACPLDLCNPEDCPFFTVRKMDRRERSRWFDALEEKDLTFLAFYHYTCLDTRVESELVKVSRQS